MCFITIIEEKMIKKMLFSELDVRDEVLKQDKKTVKVSLSSLKSIRQVQSTKNPKFR